jgi:hypothetical protein
MPNGDYYREQARILMRWADAATDQRVAQQLSYRAHELLQLAEKLATTDIGREKNDSLNAALSNAVRQRCSRLR